MLFSNKSNQMCVFCNHKNPVLTYSTSKVKNTVIVSPNDIESFDEELHFKFKSGKIIKVDFAAHFGNWYLYYASKNNHKVLLCSRECAIHYAALNKAVLFKIPDSSRIKSIEIVYPEQSYFDNYSKENNIKQRYTIGDQEYLPSENIEDILETAYTNPEQIFNVAQEIIAKGQTNKGYKAAQKIIGLNQFSIYNISLASILLSSLQKYREVDAAFERIKNKFGNYNIFPAETLSTWAFMILPINSSKSLRLSKKAINKSPNKVEVIENHLSILYNISNGDGYKYLLNNQHKIKTDTGFFTAGQIHLKMGNLQLAKDNFEVALMIHPNPETYKELAYVNLLLVNYADGLSNITDGKKLLESLKSDYYERGDGKKSYYLAIDYDQKKYLTKAFLAIEGKIHIHLGEFEYGKKLLIDTLDIQIENGTNDPIFKDLKNYIAGYKSKAELNVELIKSQKDYFNSLSQVKTIKKKVDSLSALLDKISETKSEWHEVLTELKEDAVSDEISENYLNKLHSLSYFLKSYDQQKYESVRREFKNKFNKLSTDVLNFYSNGIYLMDNLSKTLDSNEDIYACVVIEISKAIERAINETIVKKYFLFLSNNKNNFSNKYKIPKVTNGQENSNACKHLMFYEIIQLLSSNDNNFTNFIVNNYTTIETSYITNVLPKLLYKIKNHYRNGSAHYSSVSRAKAEEFVQMLNENEIFPMLNKL